MSQQSCHYHITSLISSKVLPVFHMMILLGEITLICRIFGRRKINQMCTYFRVKKYIHTDISLSLSRFVHVYTCTFLADHSLLHYTKHHHYIQYHRHTSKSTILLLAKSALLPERAMTMFGLACLCSSFTHDFARTNVSCTKIQSKKESFYIKHTIKVQEVLTQHH